MIHEQPQEAEMGIVAELRAKAPRHWPAWRRPEPEGRIYYIGCTETLRLKIGWTAGSPYERMAKLQTGSPTQLVMLGSRLSYAADEKSCHRRFRKEQVRGEWFRISERMIVHLEYVASEELGRETDLDNHRLLRFARKALEAAAAESTEASEIGMV